MNLDWMIKYILASDNITMILPVLPTHHIPARDDVSTEVTYESIPNLDVGNRSDSVGWTGKVFGGRRLWSILQCIQNGTPVTFAVSMKASQMSNEGIVKNSDATFSTNRNPPGLIIANDRIWMEERRSVITM